MGSDDGVPEEEIGRGFEEMGVDLVQVIEGRAAEDCGREIDGSECCWVEPGYQWWC